MDIENRKYLSEHPYPGTGILIGKPDIDHCVLTCWIMGNTPEERNRMLVRREGHMGGEFVDVNIAHHSALSVPLPDDSRIMACNYEHNWYAASNILGIATILPQSWCEHVGTVPQWTGGVWAGMNYFGPVALVEATLQVARYDEDGILWGSSSHEYRTLRPGYGRCVIEHDHLKGVTTLFQREPLIVPVVGDTAQAIAESWWEVLAPEKRVALATVHFSLKKDGKANLHIINAVTAE
jgi:hypothetical protein